MSKNYVNGFSDVRNLVNEMDKVKYHKPLDIDYSVPNLNGMISNHTHTRLLEAKVKEMYDVEYAIACSSNSIGLLITLQSSFINLCFDIYTPAFAWFSSKWAIESCGLDCIMTDIDKETWLMKNDGFNQLLVHTFGNVAKSNVKTVVYDGAHAFGSKIKDIGLATVFSLAPTKLITSCEGGIIITNNHELAERIVQLRDKVSRMSELNALWGLETLKRLNDVLEWKLECRNYYEDNLPGQFQKIPIDSNHATIGFLTDLKMSSEIEFKRYYKPLEKGLENTDYVYERIVCLPSYYGVDYKKITETILNA